MNALTIYEGGKFEIMQRTAQAMVASGYFKDSRDVAQAVVKVMAGAELGIAPFAAMSGIHIVQGRPTLSSNLIATLVKNDSRYNYKVKACDDKQAVLVWYEDGEAVGESSFTMKEADGAGLTSKAVWKQYPSDMLFARALTRGARRFAPGIFGGSPVYTPEEVGLDVDENGGTVYEGSYTPVSIQANAEPDDDIIEGQAAAAATSPRTAQEEDDKPAMPVKPTPAMTKRFHALGTEVYGSGWEEKRPQLVSHVTKGRSESSKHLERDEMKRLIAGLEERVVEKELDGIERKHHG